MNNNSMRLPLLPPCQFAFSLCMKQSERVFERQVEETHCRTLGWISSTIQTTANDSLSLVLKILCFKKL